MNERIRELAEQAGFIRFSPEEDPQTPIDWASDYTLELEKFSELIVRECVAAVLDLEMSNSGFVASVIEGRLGYEQQSLWNENDE